MEIHLQKLYIIFAIVVLSSSCAQDDGGKVQNDEIEQNLIILPSLTTYAVEEIKSTSAKFLGKVTAEGSEPILERGFCWSTSPNPTLENFKIAVEELPGGYHVAPINNLTRATTYYVRAYASNLGGTAYGEEQVFSTLDNYLMFRADRIVQNALHNPQDKLIYLFTHKNANGTEYDFKVTAYNYEIGQVVAQKQIDMYRDALHTIANYNNEIELYIFKGNSIHILDGITLNEIQVITLPQTSGIRNAELLNNLLFISANYPNGHNLAITMNRQTLSIIDEHESNGIFGLARPYITASNPNIINCAFFPQYSSANYIVHSYNLTGNYQDFQIGRNSNEGLPIRYNENTNFIVKGNHGRIYLHDNLMEDHYSLEPTENLIDYNLNMEGSAIYALHYDKKIYKYNTTTFTLDKIIDIREEGKNIFVDGSQLIVVDYRQGLEETDVYISFYEDN